MNRLLASLFLVSCASAPPPAAAPSPPAPPPPPVASASLPVASASAPAAVEPAIEPTSEASRDLSAPVVDPGCKRDAIVLIVDRSGSMTGAPMEFAKAAAKGVVAKIGKEDCFGLVVFDSQPSRVIKLISPLDKAAATREIDKVNAGGGTEIFSALDLAYEDLRAAKAAKHRIAILLTDGQAPHDGIRDLVDAMAAWNIKVSTIGLGSGIDETMLRTIADKGNGHLRKVISPADLAKNIEEELASLRR